MKATTFGRTAAVLLVSALAACDPAPEDPPDSGDTPAAGDATSAVQLAPGAHRWTTADGNTMPYTVTGEGEATVVLVHCWMCDRTFWSEQVPVLSQHYRTVALDLPGHGEATANREVWKVSTYGEDVAALDFANVDTVAWMSEAGVPIRAVNAAGPNPTLVEVNRKYADFDAVLVEDVGHYLHMTRPERFNPLLLEAIAEVLNQPM